MARQRLRLPKVSLDPDRLPFIPRNEQGVVLVFGMFAQELGFTVQDVQVRFPDCIANYRGQDLRIEFEFNSGSFQVHRHNPRKCDLIICWKHRWPNAAKRYRNLPVLELSKLFGIGWNVWLQNMDSYYADKIPGGNRYTGLFSVPSQAGPDDLLLIYRPRPSMFISDIVRVATPVERTFADWKKDYDWMAEYQRVAKLDEAITLDQLAIDLGVKRERIGAAIQGGRRITAEWPRLRRRLIRTNPNVGRKLAAYGPDRA